MKTKFKLGGHAVVTNESGEIVAVICIPNGEGDITKQLEQAVKEHECAESAKLVLSKDLTDSVFEIDGVSFTASIVEAEDVYKKKYHIEMTATYY